MTITKKYILIVLFIILATQGFSQYNNYVKGYVVKESRDTIFGKHKDMSDERSCFKIKFIDSNGNKVKFKNRDVYAYKKGNELYLKKSYERPISISDMKGFMKVINNGNVKLLQFNYVVHNSGSMNTNGGMTGGEMIGVTSSFQQDYYIEKDNRLLLVRKMGFKKTMSEFFSDNSEIVDKIKNKDLKYSDIKEIVRLYNRSKE